MQFTKMHGLGNDFIIINGLDNDISTLDLSQTAIQLCNRNFGIGADGLIIVESSTKADSKMRIINPDGSEPEMCGNGIRCFAKYIFEAGITNSLKLSVETGAGIINPTLKLVDNKVVEVCVDMGEPRLSKQEIPMGGDNPNDRVIAQSVDIAGEKVCLTAVSMGNPHCVIFVDDIDTAKVKQLGPQIENHTLFPKRTNVEFAQIIDQSTIKMRVWERGTGETLACGTGACAVAVAGVLTEQTNRQVAIQLPGGKLSINWQENDNHVFMTGPAETVYTGDINL